MSVLTQAKMHGDGVHCAGGEGHGLRLLVNVMQQLPFGHHSPTPATSIRHPIRMSF